MIDKNSNYGAIVAGYLAGFITALGFSIFWGSFNDEINIWSELRKPFGIVSLIPVLLLFLIAFSFFALGLSGKVLTVAAISASFSGMLVNQGVYPLIKYVDDRQRFNKKAS